MKERVKKTKFLTTIITLIILLIGAIAVPAYAEVPSANVSNIDMPNTLLVGLYGFDLNDPENNNYNLNNFIRACRTAYEREQNVFEIYWYHGGKWYELVSDPYLKNPIGDPSRINGNGLYSYGNMIPGYWLNQAIIKAIKDVNAAGTREEMRTALQENKSVLVPDHDINDLMADALLENKGDGYRTLAEILAVLKTVIEELTSSTYEFSYQVPADVVAGSEVEVPVTFATDVKGDYGYDGVRFKYAAQGPGTVTFKAVDSNGVEHTFTNQGYWGPAGGFDLPADYSATTDWTLVFSAAGQYTITFSLIDAVTEDVVAGITETVTVDVAPVPVVSGTIGRDPANTGGDLEYIILGDTVTFTGGEIKWYPEDPVLGRAAGNRVGVQINAPAGFDTSGVTVTIGENTYNWEDIKDGDNYFWWYPLVTVAGQEFTAKVKWNESSEQTFKVVIGSGVELEENILEGYVVKVGENGLGVDAAKFLNAVAKWDGSTLEYDNGSIIFRGSPDKDAYGRKSGLYVSKVAPLKERTFATTGEAYVSLTNGENTYYVVFDAAAVSGLNDGRTSKYLCGIPAPGTGYDEAVELAGVEGYVFDFFFGQDKAAAYLEREDAETSYYSSIQAAIDDATEGNNTIKVLPGDHGTDPIQIIQKEDVNITLKQ